MTQILLAQINTIFGDLDGNSELILQSLKKARSKNCSLVITPELALSGYPPNDLLFRTTFIEKHDLALKKIQQATDGITLVIGCVRINTGPGNPLFNSAVIFRDQKLIGTYDKMLLPTYDVFEEKRYFEPGSSPYILNHEGLKIALTICEDIWDEAMPSLYNQSSLNQLISFQPDFLVNLSASPFEVQKHPKRIEICKQVSKKLNCPTIYCNQVGGCDALIFDGSSFICDATTLLGQASRFKQDSFVIDAQKLENQLSLVEDPREEVYQALLLGIKDFFNKQNFTKAIIALSGGIDSALVATLAAHALGSENVLAISMPSRHSSKGSVDDALKLSKNLNIEFKKIPIESVHSSFLKLVKAEFSKFPEDITEENLQARIRGTLVMAFSNKLNRLVLSCGNKSEMAMGYATLYGDLAGALAVISDLTKSEVYALCEWINSKQSLIPESILLKPPSAELRPNQKDSDTLPDYSILDPIIQAYVDEGLSEEQIASKHNHDLDFVMSIIKKIHRSEHKRRQSPLGLKVSRKAFSNGWKYPIVQKWS